MTTKNLGARIAAWTARTFGPGSMLPRERAARLLEEAAELAQVEGVPPHVVQRIVDRVFSGRPGDRLQEAAGVALCLVAYCEAIGADPIDLAEVEAMRVEALPPEHFRKRHAAKVAYGAAEEPEP